MRNLSREWVGVSLDENVNHIIPMFRLSENAATKTIQNVADISNIHIYHLNFTDEKIRKAGTIPFPPNKKADVSISFNPEKEEGQVTIQGTDQIWYFDVKFQPPQSQTPPKEASDQLVDQEKLRQLEEEEKKLQKKTIYPDELAAELEKEIFGQEYAIKVMSETIAANLRRKKQEILTFVLFGPTGVGKTEIGKKLPEVLTKLTGNQYGYQQIACSELKEAHYNARFFGSPPGYVGYGQAAIPEPARENPYQVFLLDEIEKANDQFLESLMEVFSTGSIRLADNSPRIDLSRSIFVLTSNVKVDMEKYNNASSDFEKKEICRDTLANQCGRPEIAGKINNCIAFQPLSSEALTSIVGKFVVEEFESYGMHLKNMDEKLMIQLKNQHSNYGARGIRDVVRDAIIRSTIYDRDIERFEGKKIKITGDINQIFIDIIPDIPETDGEKDTNL